MGDACFHTEDAACPTCALARTFGASPDDARFDVTCLSCSCGVTTIARQARTIRRLFTAYFLAKAKSMRNGQAAADNCATCLVAGIEDGKREERARIVAAMRDLDLISEYGAVPSLLADAIERGEL